MSEKITNAELDALDCYVDLHLHLDGSLSLNMVKELAKVQEMELPYSDDEILQLLQVEEGCNSLDDYLTKFVFPNSFLQTEEGIFTAVKMLGQELKEQGVMYAEVRFAPQKHCKLGLTQGEVVCAAIEGAQKSPIPLKLILCCMRGSDNYVENVETIYNVVSSVDHNVVAADLAGAEALFPTSGFGELFSMAKELNVPFTIHAGEASGPESIYKALEYGAKRIGHGVRATEDSKLVERLAKEGIVLECCPTSNLNTAIFKSLSDFPYREFMDSGVKFTINTDNMSVSNTTIKNEFKKLNDVFGLTKGEVRKLILNAIDASFAEDDLKESLREQVNL